jgi:hypothetical protein
MPFEARGAGRDESAKTQKKPLLLRIGEEARRLSVRIHRRLYCMPRFRQSATRAFLILKFIRQYFACMDEGAAGAGDDAGLGGLCSEPV